MNSIGIDRVCRCRGYYVAPTQRCQLENTDGLSTPQVVQ